MNDSVIPPDNTISPDLFNTKNRLRSTKYLFAIVGTLLVIVWFFAHIPGVLYGTQNVPLHMSYVGDEQAPVNGALHILNERNPLALRNLTTVYYGPVFSLIATPSILFDYLIKLRQGVVNSSEEYKNAIIFDWGGIIIGDRVMAVFFSFLGLVFFFLFLNTKTINPSGNRWLALMGTVLLASNFYYFEYSNFFRHWIFIMALFLGQMYFIIRIIESAGQRRIYWIWYGALSLVSFGISYLGLLFQVIWLPVLLRWIRNRAITELKNLCRYLAIFIVGVLLIILWHPYGFFRILGLTTVNSSETNTLAVISNTSLSESSFIYYLDILVSNHFPLLLMVFAVVSFLLFRFKSLPYWLWTMLTPALLYLFVFGFIPHHEARYALPIIVLTVAMSVALLVYSWEWITKQRLFYIAMSTLMIFQLLFNVVHISKWDSIMAHGPKERVIIEQTLVWQREKQTTATLFVQPYILGYVHTKAAYRDFIYQTGREQYPLYQTLLQSNLPQNQEWLNVFYHRPEIPLPQAKFTSYDHVVLRYDPTYASAPFDPQFDFIDARLTRLWFYDDFLPQYIILK